MSHTGDKTTKPRVTPVFNWNGWSRLTVSDLRTDPVSCKFSLQWLEQHITHRAHFTECMLNDGLNEKWILEQ